MNLHSSLSLLLPWHQKEVSRHFPLPSCIWQSKLIYQRDDDPGSVSHPSHQLLQLKRNKRETFLNVEDLGLFKWCDIITILVCGIIKTSQIPVPKRYRLHYGHFKNHLRTEKQYQIDVCIHLKTRTLFHKTSHQ